jgi:hypothetical protein
MSIIMKDQANKEWLRESIMPISNVNRIISYSMAALSFILVVIAVSLTLISMAVADTADDLMISSDMKSYMQMNGLTTISEWDVE